MGAEAIRIEGSHLPLGQDRYSLVVEPGTTVRDIVEKAAVPNAPVTVTVNGTPVARSKWKTMQPAPGAIVTIAPEAGIEFVITALVATALSVAASLLLPRPSAPDAPEIIPRIEGGSNNIAPWMPIPVVFGQLRYAPPAANDWVPYIAGASTTVRSRTGFIPGEYPTGPIIDGQNVWMPVGASNERKQWIRTLLCWGLGRIDLTGIKLGATVEADFGDGVEMATAVGDNSDFEHAIRVVEIGADLNGATTVKRFLGRAASEVTVNLLWPAGLYRVNNKGEIHGFDEPMSSKLERRPVLLRIKVFASDGVTELATEDVSAVGGTNQTPFHQSHTLTIADEQDVILTVERMTARRESGQVLDDLQVHSAVMPLTDAAILPETTNTSVRIQATDQISGTIPVISGIGHAHHPDWDPVADDWVTRATRNPASAFRAVLMGSGNARAYAESEILMSRLQDWHEWCATEGFTYDAVHMRVKSVDAVLEEIAAAGRARPAWITNKRGIIIDRAQANRVQVFTPSNSANFQGSRAAVRVPHALRCRFRDRDKDYAVAEIIVYRPGFTEATATLIEQRTIAGVTRRDTISALLAYQLRSALNRRERYRINVDWEHLVSTVGDRVALSHDAVDPEAHSGRVLETSTDAMPTTLNGVDMDITVDDNEIFVRVDFAGGLDFGGAYTAIIRRDDTETVATYAVKSAPDTDRREILLGEGWFVLEGGVMQRPDVEVGNLIAVYQQATGVEDCFLEAIDPTSEASARLSLVQYGGNSVFSAQAGYTVQYIDPQGEIADVPFGEFELARRPPNTIQAVRVAYIQSDDKPDRPITEDIPGTWSATQGRGANWWISRQDLTIYPLVADPLPALTTIGGVSVPVGSEVDPGPWSDPESIPDLGTDTATSEWVYTRTSDSGTLPGAIVTTEEQDEMDDFVPADTTDNHVPPTRALRQSWAAVRIGSTGSWGKFGNWQPWESFTASPQRLAVYKHFPGTQTGPSDSDKAITGTATYDDVDGTLSNLGNDWVQSVSRDYNFFRHVLAERTLVLLEADDADIDPDDWSDIEWIDDASITNVLYAVGPRPRDLPDEDIF